MKHFQVVTIAAASLLLQFAAPAYAHTAVAGTNPKSGSVLERSPAVVEISFEHAAHLTSVVLVAAGKPERKLAFTPSGGATTFRLPDPALAPGRNEIRWKALSSDGHVVSGSMVLVIRPPGAQTN
jgi:methionine-rich copper-binding protein CopC